MNISHSSQSVNPQAINLYPGAEIPINYLVQDNIVPRYSVDASQGPTYMDNVSKQVLGNSGMRESRAIDHPSIVTKPKVVPPQHASGRTLALPKAQLGKALPGSQKKPNVITYGGPTSNPYTVYTSDTAGPQRSDNSSFKPPLTTDEVASQKLVQTIADIGKRLDNTQNLNKKDLESIFRSIKKEVDEISESNGAGNRNDGNSSSREADDIDNRFICKVCHKRKKSQCDLKYIPTLFIWSSRGV